MGACTGKTNSKQSKNNLPQILLPYTSVVTAQPILKESINMESQGSQRSFNIPQVHISKNLENVKQDDASMSHIKLNSILEVEAATKNLLLLEIGDDQSKNIRGRKRQQTKLPQLISSQSDNKRYELFKVIDKSKTQFQLNLISESLKLSKIFKQLSQNEKLDLINKMFYCFVKSKKSLFNQGDSGSCFFFIGNSLFQMRNEDKGELEVIQDGKSLKTLTDGDWFGETSLIFNQPRSATLQALKDTYLWALDRKTFKNILSDINERQFDSNKILINSIKIFQPLSEEQKEGICRTISSLIYSKNEIITKQGDSANSIIIIKSGKAQTFKDDIFVKEYSDNDYLGESSLTGHGNRNFTLKSIVDNLICLEITKKQLHNILGNKLEMVLYHNNIRKILHNNSHTKKLKPVSIEKIIVEFEIQNYKQNDVVVQNNTKLDQILIVLEGSLKYLSSEKTLCKRGHIYGVEQLAKQQTHQIIFDDLIMPAQDGIIATISLDTLMGKIGTDFSKTMGMVKGIQAEESTQLVQNTQKCIRIQYVLGDFVFIKRLDTTAYGKILLVHNQLDENLYQMRTFVKNRIIEDNLEIQLDVIIVNISKQYKGILQLIQFPFLTDYIRSFKDQDYIYFLSSYVKGQTFYEVMRETGLMGMKESQFYVSSLVIILEYLHTNNIIHRDVQPSSFIVDEMGYLRANNLECAKLVQNGRTKTVIGAPHYVAPEVLKNKGYNYAVDLWSLGICAYEFVCGYVPFAAEQQDPILIYEEILSPEEIKYPFFVNDKRMKSLISRLLSPIPEKRLGGSYAVLKAHPFFDNMDWVYIKLQQLNKDELANQQIKTPYIPHSEKFECTDIYALEKIDQGHKLSELKKSEDQYNPEEARDRNWDAIY